MSKASFGRLSAARIMARLFVILASLSLAALLVFHQQIPDVAGLGLVLDNIAPWLGLGIPLLLFLAIGSGGRGTYITLLVPVAAWAVIFGQAVLPAKAVEGPGVLTVATQNVHQDAVQSAMTLAESGAEVITLQELGEGQIDLVTKALKKTHPHFYSVSTVGLWSKYPLSNAQPLDLGLGWDRALRVDVASRQGDLRVYAVHAASARPMAHAERDKMLGSLSGYIAKDSSKQIVALGDFNATSTDRNFSAISKQLDEVRSQGWGLPMTWPTSPFPMLGIDHVLTRGIADSSMEKISAGDSDHYGLRASIALDQD